MRRIAVVLVVSIVCAVGAQASSAATITVIVGPGGATRFSPANATIHLGDTVRWVWQSNSHSSTSGPPSGVPDGKWDSGVQNTGFKFSRTFTSTGTFHYFCSVHVTFGMVGTIAVAPALPTVTTGAATAITATSATLHGSVNPNKSDTHYFFQYGTTRAYGKATAHLDAGAGSKSVAVSAMLKALAADATYHYRLVASSKAGTRLGTDKTFQTS